MTVWRRTVGGAAVVVLAAAALAGCQSGKASLNCGKEAVRLAGDLQDVTDRATNVGNLVDPVRRKQTSDALDKLQRDAGDLGGDSSDQDRRHAVHEISTAVTAARASVTAGHVPDLDALAAAVADWSKTCGIS